MLLILLLGTELRYKSSVKTLPNGKVLDQPKLKEFIDSNINVTQKFRSER